MKTRRRFRLVIVEYLREIIFGLEDSLVSTLGAVTGIATGAQNEAIVVMSGLVIIAVEAVSMCAGSYLSSKSAEEAESAFFRGRGGRRNDIHGSPIRAGLVMLVAYALGGLVPLLPYLLFRIQDATFVSITATAVALFLLGVWSSKYTKRPTLRSGLEMFIISLGAAFIGYLIGRFASLYLPLA